MPYTVPPASKLSISLPNEFMDIDLRSDEVSKEQVSKKHNQQPLKPSKKTAKQWYLIGILFFIIVILSGFIAFVLTHPDIIGKPCLAPVNFAEPSTLVHTRTIIRTRSLNTTTITTQTANKTNPASQATGMAHGIDPVAVATCLGVLENACAMKNSSTTFGECDPLFEFFYCDLTDMMMFRGAIEPDADGSSTVCQPMKRFCSKATALNKHSL